MLLNPNDYRYMYFQQHRAHGGEGDSESIYLGTPKKPGLSKVLVKSHLESDAINEYLACNVGQKLGINTPKAWLFRSGTGRTEKEINFNQAVGIEYLEGFNDKIGGSYDTEELAVQTIRGKLLHILMNEKEAYSLGRYQGKIYAYDFAEGLFHAAAGREFSPLMFLGTKYVGIDKYISHIMIVEDNIRRKIQEFADAIEEYEIASMVFQQTYEVVKNKYVELFNGESFIDLIREIDQVYGENACVYAYHLLTASYYALLSPFNSEFLLIESRKGVGDGTIVHMALPEEEFNKKFAEFMTRKYGDIPGLN